MDTFDFIQQEIRTAFPNSTALEVTDVANAIYQNLLQNQGKQDISYHQRESVLDITAKIATKWGQGYTVLQMALVGESTIPNPAAPGALQDFVGLSGIILYTKP